MCAHTIRHVSPRTESAEPASENPSLQGRTISPTFPLIIHKSYGSFRITMASTPGTTFTLQSQVSPQRKRSVQVASPADSELSGRRKAQKVSRACDLCKAKKARCTGTRPCENCVRKGLDCVYDARYSRGRPPTPPPGSSVPLAERQDEQSVG